MAPDLRDPVYALVAVGRSVTWPPGPTRLPGLDPNGRYRVRLQPPGCDTGSGWPTPALVEPESTRVFGRVSQLAEVRAGEAP